MMRIWQRFGVAVLMTAAIALVGSGGIAAASGTDRDLGIAKRVRAESVQPGVQAIVVGLRNLDGRWEEFWRGSDCHLWHRWQLSPGGAWSGPHSLDGCLTSDVDGRPNADGRLEIFGRGTNNALWHIFQTRPNGWWGNWESLFGILTSKPYTWITTNGGIVVDVVGNDGRWYRNYQTKPNCCWSGWFPL